MAEPIFPPEHKHQIICEAIYLVVLFVVAGAIALLLNLGVFPVAQQTRVYLYAFVGGLLGGWAFTMKWFYRSFARLKDGETEDRWEPRRLLWRIFTPFVAATVATAVYLAGASGAIFIKIQDTSGAFAYAMCFFLGYFSDAVVSKMANVMEKMIDD